MLFEDHEHLQGEGVNGEHGGPVNHRSVGKDHVRKQVLQKYEGMDSERFGGLIDEENEEGSIQTSGAKLENLETNLGELKMQHSSVCWDGNIDERDNSSEEKVFYLLANPIRGFKY